MMPARVWAGSTVAWTTTAGSDWWWRNHRLNKRPQVIGYELLDHIWNIARPVLSSGSKWGDQKRIMTETAR